MARARNHGPKIRSGKHPVEFATRAQYLAEQYKVMERMAKIAGESEDEGAAVAAGKVILAYAYGQPKQSVDLTGKQPLTIRVVHE